MGRDKIEHAVAGVAVALLARWAGFSPFEAFSIAALVGVLKEMHDATGRGTVDPLDAAATALGGAFGSMV